MINNKFQSHGALCSFKLWIARVEGVGSGPNCAGTPLFTREGSYLPGTRRMDFRTYKKSHDSLSRAIPCVTLLTQICIFKILRYVSALPALPELTHVLTQIALPVLTQIALPVLTQIALPAQ